MSTPLRRYYRGTNLVAMRDVQAATTSYYHFDHQGTTQCLTNSSGTVTDRFASDAWGVQVKRTGSSINRQWYIGNFGYYRQKDQMLDYVRARYLDVMRARWLAQDPSGADARPFAYSANRPPSRVDPSGLINCTVLGAQSKWTGVFAAPALFPVAGGWETQVFGNRRHAAAVWCFGACWESVPKYSFYQWKIGSETGWDPITNTYTPGIARFTSGTIANWIADGADGSPRMATYQVYYNLVVIPGLVGNNCMWQIGYEACDSPGFHGPNVTYLGPPCKKNIPVFLIPDSPSTVAPNGVVYGTRVHREFCTGFGTSPAVRAQWHWGADYGWHFPTWRANGTPFYDPWDYDTPCPKYLPS